ncbi:MAG: hypothetical protein AABZ67_00645 [Pseudomonadota bacterium]
MAKKTKRDEDISDRKEIRKALLDTFADVDKGFSDQWQRANDTMDWWDIYDAKLGGQQAYDGNSRIFVPIVRNAVNARVTRFVNQLFPQTGRNVEVTTENGDIPHPLIALGEHYVRALRLRTEVAPALVRNGDIEGQYNLYVGWQETSRYTAVRTKKPPKIGGLEFQDLEPVVTVENETVVEAGPYVEVVPDSDVLILPATCDNISQALASGGSVTIIRRWTKARVKAARREGLVLESTADKIVDGMRPEAGNRSKDAKKEHADAAGIKANGNVAQVYETWTMLEVDGKDRLCRAFYGGNDLILGCKLNPYWYDMVPLISAPVEKVSGSFKGVSKIKAVAKLQYNANDIVNQGADSATYSMLPIIMTNPEKNPNVGSMVMDLAAVWMTSPQDTQFATFPEIWKEAFAYVAGVKNQIFETLGVNTAMITQQTGGKGKKNQAEAAQEQQVDILTTADAVTVLEEGIFTPMLQWFMWLDHQFRDEDITVRQFGQMGRRARMDSVEPIQMGNRYFFRWFGVEAARNAAQIQQQIAAINVIRGIPQQLYQGRTLDVVPFIEHLAENAFGPRLAPLIFKDIREELAADPLEENPLLADGFDLDVHPLDDDMKHLQSHMEAMRAGDPHRQIEAHMQKHKMAMRMKSAALMGGMLQGPGQPGVPGGGQPGGGAAPGVAGTPRPGSQPGPMRPRGPNGSIHQDRMPAAGAVGMPRKM